LQEASLSSSEDETSLFKRKHNSPPEIKKTQIFQPFLKKSKITSIDRKLLAGVISKNPNVCCNGLNLKMITKLEDRVKPF
jgi:hypothetical protein